MGSEVIIEGLRQTRVIGLVLFCAALVCGILAHAADFVEVYVDALFKYIPYIPLLIIIYLLRWLGDPHARDFYCSLNISASDMIKKYILISQIYVWIVFLISIPFFLEHVITVSTYYGLKITIDGTGFSYIGSDAVRALYMLIFNVAGTSLLVTGITLIVCALVYSTVAQFFLTVAVMVLPGFIVEFFSTHLNRLFLNTGESYYYETSITWDYFSRLNSGVFTNVALVVFGILLILLGLLAIEKLRIGNATILSRILNSVACATISFYLVLNAAFNILLYLIDSIYVSFNSIVSLSVAELVARFDIEASTLPDKAPWLLVIVLCFLGLSLLIIFTVRSAYRQKNKWIDYTAGFGALLLFSAAFFSVFFSYYSDAVKRFAHDEVDYVRIEDVFANNDAQRYVNFTDALYLTNYSEEEPSGPLSNSMGNYYRFVKTADGNLHAGFGPGNAAAYFSARLELSDDIYKNTTVVVNSDARKSLYATQWRNEIKDILLNAVNRDAGTVETVIGAFAPVPLTEDRRYLVVRISMKDGSSYLRKCFLAESEWKRIDALLSDA